MVVVLDMLCFAWALTLLNGNLPAYILAQFLIVLVALHQFALFHECVHGNALSSSKLNSLLGHFCSLFCYLPYFPWKSIHREHHLWAGIVDKDPVLALINNYKPERKYLNFVVKKTWKLWIPIAEVFQTLLYWVYPLVLMRKEKFKWSFFGQSVFSSCWLLVTYAALFHYFPHLFNFKNFAPAFLMYLLLQEIITLPHHMGMPMYKFQDKSTKLPLWEQFKIARTCFYAFPLGEILVLNFNFHIEHHLFPQLPWYRLRGAAQLVKPLLQGKYEEVPHLRWSLENRQKECTEVFYRPYEEYASKDLI